MRCDAIIQLIARFSLERVLASVGQQLGIAAQRENARVRGRLVGILIVVVCMAFVSMRVHFKGETQL